MVPSDGSKTGRLAIGRRSYPVADGGADPNLSAGHRERARRASIVAHDEAVLDADGAAAQFEKTVAVLAQLELGDGVCADQQRAAGHFQNARGICQISAIKIAVVG